MIKPFFRSFRLLRPRQRLIFVSLTTTRVLTNLLDVFGLVAIGLLGAMLASGLNEKSDANFFGFSIEMESSRTYFYVVLVIAAFFISKSVIGVVLLRLTSIFLARAEGKAAREVAEYVFSGDHSRLKQFSRGDLQFALTLSGQYAMNSLLMAGTSIATDGALFLAVVVVFLLVDQATAFLIAAYFVVLVGAFQVIVNRRLRSSGERVRDSSIGVTDTIQDFTAAFREIVVFSKTIFFFERFSGFRMRFALDMALQKFLIGLPRYFVEAALMVGVLGLIGWQFLQDSLSAGLVTTAVFLAGGVRMMAALLPLQRAFAEIKTLGAQAEMAQGLLELARQEKKESLASTASASKTELEVDDVKLIGHRVELTNVEFSYLDAKEPAVRGVSMSVPAGGYVAFVGPSGAGKTTLADLILGVNKPSSGEILLDGQPPQVIRQNHPGEISYVPQSPGLVSGSIAENVAIGVSPDDIDIAQVWLALEKAQLSDFAKSLPDGVFSHLGRQSDSLSGGQKQRLGLARALYTSPRLLVLDEATSALDAGAEAGVSAAIAQLGSSTTVIVIAHRLSTIQDAECVYVIEEGRVSAFGSFAEVREKAPIVEEYVRMMSFHQGQGSASERSHHSKE